MITRGKHIPDRRIQKTRHLLHEALGSLIREKPYGSIAVQEILDRANVGRSTFYTHFEDKDQLLVSGIRDLLRSAYPADLPASDDRCEAIMRFSLPVFKHIHGHLRTGAAEMGPQGRAAIHHHLRDVLVELIGHDVKLHLKRRTRTAGLIPPDLLVSFIASTFILVLEWWVDLKAPLSPTEIDDLFRALVAPTISSALC